MWEVRFARKARKQISKLPKNVQENITKAAEEKLSPNPDFYLSRLSGYKKNFYKFRVNDYRLLCLKGDKEITIISVSHRRSIYKTEID